MDIPSQLLERRVRGEEHTFKLKKRFATIHIICLVKKTAPTLTTFFLLHLYSFFLSQADKTKSSHSPLSLLGFQLQNLSSELYLQALLLFYLNALFPTCMSTNRISFKYSNLQSNYKHS